MLYALRMSNSWISVVNSETLKHSLYSYEEVYDMLLEGIEIDGLYVSKLFTDEEILENLSLSKECLMRHKGITRAGALPTGYIFTGYIFVKPKESIPVSLRTTTDTDLSVALDNVIIFRDKHYYRVWFDDCGYDVWRKDVVSFHFLQGKLVVGYKENYSVDGCYIENYDKVMEKYDCSMSQFKRKWLFT